MRKTFLFLLVLLLAFTILASCTKEEGQPESTFVPTQTPEPEEPPIAVVLAGQTEFNQAFAQTVKPLIEAAGYRTIDYYSASADKQEDDMYAAIGAGVECIVILPHDMDNLQIVLEECHVQGIPVVNAMVPINGVVSTLVSPDYREVGSEVADVVKSAWPDGAKVLTVEGNFSPFVTQMMRDGFVAEAAKTENVELLDSILIDENEMNVFDKVTESLGAHPDINAIYVMEDVMTKETLRAVRENGNDIQLVCVGGSSETMQMIADGTVFASVTYSPAQLAELAGEYALITVNAQTGEIPAYAQMKLEVITKDNVADYQAAGGYAGLLTPPEPSLTKNTEDEKEADTEETSPEEEVNGGDGEEESAGT